MATPRQIAANRANALKSTGPKTEEGKARSRANALTRGLTGAGAVHFEEDAAALDARQRTWAAELSPTTARQRWLVEQAAAESLRVEHCQRHESAMRALEAGRAATSWDLDRRLAAESLGATLARKPSIVARKLAATPQGCDWLIERWEGLASLPEWDDAAKSRALDLLGTPPELRAGPTVVDAEPSAHHALASAEIARLRARKSEGLDDLDALEREAAAAGFPAAFSRPMALLHRYERASARRVDLALDALRKAKAAPTPEGLDDFEDEDFDLEAPASPPPVERAPEPIPSQPPAPPNARPIPAPPRPVAAIETPRRVSMAGGLRSQLLSAPDLTNRHARRALRAMA